MLALACMGEVEVFASDVLALEYQKLWREHGATPVVPVQYQDFERLSYSDETFDIVHAVNCLDHTEDAFDALHELERVCKTGGWIYLRHAPDQMKRFGGKHYWNIYERDGECWFMNKKNHFKLGANYKVHLEGERCAKILPVQYARPPFPIPLFKRFCATARKLGYTVRGHRWQLLDFLLDYADAHPDLFRKR